MAHSEIYSDWVDLRIADTCPGPISVQHAQVNWGNFYNTENVELGPYQLEGTVIKPGQRADVCARGRQGSLDLVDITNNARICTLSWNCSYDGSNNLEVENKNDNYGVTLGDWGCRGPLGTVLIGVSYP